MTSPKKDRRYTRPSILFSQTPHSISRRAKLLPRTAAELLRHLCELTIGYGRGSTQLTYAMLAQELHRSWTTIARSVRLLRDENHIAIETLKDGSYRWYVLLEPEDIRSDPDGVYRLRPSQENSQVGGDGMPPHGVFFMTPMAKAAWDNSDNAMTSMAQTPWGHPLPEDRSNPDEIKVKATSEQLEKEPLKIILKDKDLKKDHQRDATQPNDQPLASASDSDDEPLDHKMLLQKLQQFKVSQRVSRQLLNQYPHHQIAQVLDQVACRQNIKNPAGYIVRALQDGGYSQVQNAASPELTMKPPITYQSVDRTKTEREHLEAEAQRKEDHYQQTIQTLLDRFQALPEPLRTQLKILSNQRLQQMLPNTTRKKTMLNDPTFQRLAFKETTERFFGHLDQGLTPELALHQTAA